MCSDSARYLGSYGRRFWTAPVLWRFAPGSARLTFHRPSDAIPPQIVQLGHGTGEFGVSGSDGELIATHGANAEGRNAEKFGALDSFYGIERCGRDNDTTLRLAEEESVGAKSRKRSSSWFGCSR